MLDYQVERAEKQCRQQCSRRDERECPPESVEARAMG